MPAAPGTGAGPDAPARRAQARPALARRAARRRRGGAARPRRSCVRSRTRRRDRRPRGVRRRVRRGSRLPGAVEGGAVRRGGTRRAGRCGCRGRCARAVGGVVDVAPARGGHDGRRRRGCLPGRRVAVRCPRCVPAAADPGDRRGAAECRCAGRRGRVVDGGGCGHGGCRVDVRRGGPAPHARACRGGGGRVGRRHLPARPGGARPAARGGPGTARRMDVPARRADRRR